MPDDIQQKIDYLNEEVIQLYHEGRYEQALPIAIQACDLACEHLGENHPDIPCTLNNLAELYKVKGDYAAAEPLLQQALEIERRALGENHPDVAGTLNNLAELYKAKGDYAAAEPLLQQALEMRWTALGKDHFDVGSSLNNLAVLYYNMGNYAAAEPLLQQALEVYREALGENHPNVASSMYNLAGLYVATHREDEAISLAKQATAIDDRTIGQIFSISSERQRMAYLSVLQGHLDTFLSLVAQSLSHSPRAVQAALALVLRRKAIGAEALAAQRDAVLGGRYPALESELRDLSTVRVQIAQRTLAGPGPEEGPVNYQRLLMEWEAQKDRIEADLARQIPEMNLEQKLRGVDPQTVAKALDNVAPAGSALVEFIRFDVLDFHAVPARGESRWRPARYLAFVLCTGQPDHVQMIDLGEAEPIDRMIASFRASITGEIEGGDLRHLTSVPDNAIPRMSGGNGSTLRTMAFDPLVVGLGSHRRLFLSPDGDLTWLPFEVLPAQGGRRLIDEYHISYLSVGRDVLRFGADSTVQPDDPLVAANPDFDLGDHGSSACSAPTRQVRRRSHDLDRSRLHFWHLPGTWVEGEQIAAKLGVQPLLGGGVLETMLKARRSPGIVHIATHGFFLPDQPRNLNIQGVELEGFGKAAVVFMGRLSDQWLENPLLRSGLALAGANTWLQGGVLPNEAEDGILTAEDVTGLDMLSTDLVVLSACQTGLGKVHSGEGVFGLRRAFVLAGAKTLVMSLWKVPDQQTQELMVDFYERLLTGMPRAEALRQAQLAMQAKYPNPLYWGAFICQGDPGPLPRYSARAQA